MLNILGVIDKILDVVLKRSKDAEKQRDIEIKKIDIFAKTISIIFMGVFLMCAIASLFPSLAITPYWFEIFEKFINYLFTN